jgi:GNAT superfamily N-acetyltransferase
MGVVAEVVHETPTGTVASELLGRYFDELDTRLPGGFNPTAHVATPAAELRPPVGTFLVARVTGRPVGCGALRPLDETAAEIKHMWVDPWIRGHGVGRRLLAELEQAAAGLGFATVRLDTSVHLPGAVALYRSSGYHEIPAYNDNPYAGHWFEKHLAAAGPGS